MNGVMVDFVVRLNSVQEQRRVPLISCFNASRGNSVDVCCRDPNYKDPWPDMQQTGLGGVNQDNSNKNLKLNKNKKIIKQNVYGK